MASLRLKDLYDLNHLSSVLTIREATLTDYPDVLAVNIQLVDESPFLRRGVTRSQKPTFELNRLKGCSKRPNHYLLATVDNRIVGMLRYISKRGHPTIGEFGIGILKAYQGKGYGRKLIMALITTLQKEHVKQLYLTVDARNILARGLYDSLGFRVVETREEAEKTKYRMLLEL